jgi:hypothetical protein
MMAWLDYVVDGAALSLLGDAYCPSRDAGGMMSPDEHSAMRWSQIRVTSNFDMNIWRTGGRLSCRKRLHAQAISWGLGSNAPA